MLRRFFEGCGPWTAGTRLVLAALVLTAVVGARPVAAQEDTPAWAAVPVRSADGIDEFRLPNGLQVLLVQDQATPLVTVHLTVRSGALRDPAGASGALHVLEHLMFRTQAGQTPPRTLIAQRGIRANAVTTHDRTTFTASFAADAQVQRWYLDWLARAFADSGIEQSHVEAELGAIDNEMQGAQGSALTVTVQTALEALHGPQAYGRPPIGRGAEVHALEAARLAALRAREYRPDNTTLLLVGNIDVPSTLRDVAMTFGTIPGMPSTPAQAFTPGAQRQGQQGQQARQILSLDVAQPGLGPLVVAAMPGPFAGAPDAPAIRVLMEALTRPASGPLTRRLLQEGVAARVQGQARVLARDGTLLVAVQPAAGRQPADVARALREALSEADALTPEQVEQARFGWLAEWRRRFNDPALLADDLSEAAGRGDWQLHLLDATRVRQVTLAEVQRSARWLAQPVLVTVVPEGAERRVLQSPLTESASSMAVPVAAGTPAVTTSAAKRPAAPTASTGSTASTAQHAAPSAVRAGVTASLEHGRLQVAVLRRPLRGAAVHARLAIPLLAANASQQQTRAAGLLGALLGSFESMPEGAAAFQSALDRIETVMTVGFFRQELLIDIQTSAPHFEAALAKVPALLAGSEFSAAALDREKRKWRGRLDRAALEPQTRVEEMLSRHGNPHGEGDVRYVPTLEEEVASLGGVGLQDLASLRMALWPLRGARLTVVGDVDAASVVQAMRARLVPVLASRQDIAPALVDDVRTDPGPADLVWNRAAGGSAVLTWAAFLPLRETDPEAVAMKLASRMFGQPGSGRLWRRLREREGLSYGAWSELQWQTRARSSWWRASVTFSPEQAARVRALLLEEFAAVERDGFDAEELALAKAALLQEQRRLDAQPTRLLGRQLEGLGAGVASVDGDGGQQVADVSLAEVNRVWRRYVQVDRLVRAMAGSAALGGP